MEPPASVYDKDGEGGAGGGKAALEGEPPKKRTRRSSKSLLLQAQGYLLALAKKNQMLSVQLKEYMDRDDSLVSHSQLSTYGEEEGGSQVVNSQGTFGGELDNMSLLGDPNDGLWSQQMQDWQRDYDEFMLEGGGSSISGDDMSGATTPVPSSLSAVPPLVHNVRVGVGVILTDEEGKVLVGVRKGSHGAGTIALPGGHLEMGESWHDTAVREIKEETNLDLDPASVRVAHLTNDVFDPAAKHYVTIFVTATVRQDSEPLQNMEPHKCEGWSWHSWEELRGKPREELFLPLRHALEDPNFNPGSTRRA